MSGRYSHNAYDHAMRDVKREDRQAVGEVLDAMHDREALGLDASVCARLFLNEIIAYLRQPQGMGGDSIRRQGVAAELLREFGDRP